jgi:hypothetical protein
LKNNDFANSIIDKSIGKLLLKVILLLDSTRGSIPGQGLKPFVVSPAKKNFIDSFGRTPLEPFNFRRTSNKLHEEFKKNNP